MDVTSIRPRADNVIVRLTAHQEARVEKTTKVGIIIPQMSVSEVDPTKSAEATVVACGPGYHPDKWIDHEQGTAPVGVVGFIPMDPEIVPGARVILERGDCGDRVYDDERSEYRCVRAHNIIAVLGDDK